MSSIHSHQFTTFYDYLSISTSTSSIHPSQDTPLILVRTESELKEMISEIKATCVGKEITVDVEHHDFRTGHLGSTWKEKKSWSFFSMFFV